MYTVTLCGDFELALNLCLLLFNSFKLCTHVLYSKSSTQISNVTDPFDLEVSLCAVSLFKMLASISHTLYAGKEKHTFVCGNEIV